MVLCQVFCYVFGTKLCLWDAPSTSKGRYQEIFFQRENNLSSVLSNFSIFILVTCSQMHFIASENFKQKSQESYYKLVKYDCLGECKSCQSWDFHSSCWNVSQIVITNSPSQVYTHPDDHTSPTYNYDMTPGFKPFTIKH